MKYSKESLIRAVRVERLELQQRLLVLTREIQWVEHRMKELDKADRLLEGDF